MPKMRTNAEVRYPGTAVFPGMAFWIEDQTVFESASADKAHYNNGFLDTQGSQTRRGSLQLRGGLGRGPYALRRIAAASVRFRARTLFKLSGDEASSGYLSGS
jgi:hypothetical protein